jgi:hypothetical protein
MSGFLMFRVIGRPDLDVDCIKMSGNQMFTVVLNLCSVYSEQPNKSWYLDNPSFSSLVFFDGLKVFQSKSFRHLSSFWMPFYFSTS